MALKGADNKIDKVYTPPFRVSFPAMFKPESYEGGEPKFGLVGLFAKSADLSGMQALADRAKTARFGAAVIPNFKSPFRDGAEKPNLDGYQDVKFARITTKMKPGLVDKALKPIVENPSDPAVVERVKSGEVSGEQFYAGCWARATVCAYAYDTKGNKGVAFGLLNVQKLRDDGEFTGRASAEDEFDAVDDAAFEEDASKPAAEEDF